MNLEDFSKKEKPKNLGRKESYDEVFSNIIKSVEEVNGVPSSFSEVLDVQKVILQMAKERKLPKGYAFAESYLYKIKLEDMLRSKIEESVNKKLTLESTERTALNKVLEIASLQNLYDIHFYIDEVKWSIKDLSQETKDFIRPILEDILTARLKFQFDLNLRGNIIERELNKRSNTHSPDDWLKIKTAYRPPYTVFFLEKEDILKLLQAFNVTSPKKIYTLFLQEGNKRIEKFSGRKLPDSLKNFKKKF